MAPKLTPTRSVFVTVIFGGFYLETFWSPWRPEVVLCQQINLFLNMIITRGLGSISAVRQLMFQFSKRTSSGNQSGSDNQSGSEFALRQPAHIEDLRDGSQQLTRHDFVRDGEAARSTIARLYNYTREDLPKLLQETNVTPKVWKTPLRAVRLGAKSIITLVGTELCMNIGPRFDEFGMANIITRTFNRHLYVDDSPPQYFMAANDKVFADVWVAIKCRGSKYLTPDSLRNQQWR